MARIRTVKPELWTDPEFVECSPNARLLFVAALNFASDYGVLPDKPKQLRMQCLPADNVDVDELVTELIDHGFWERRTAPDGAKVLVIRTFTRHQKVDKPTAGRWGNPHNWVNGTPPTPGKSESPRGDVGESSESARPRNGREGKGSGREGIKSSSDVTPLAIVPSPVDDDDDWVRTAGLIADARIAARPGIRNRIGYRSRVIDELRNEPDGELIRRLLADGIEAEKAAIHVLGYGQTSAPDREAPKVPWCGPDCSSCDGTAWVDTGDGLAPCPERKTA